MANSQGGGEAAFRRLDYQKKIIAYLSLGMLSKEPPIRNSVACEHLDDNNNVARVPFAFAMAEDLIIRGFLFLMLL